MDTFRIGQSSLVLALNLAALFPPILESAYLKFVRKSSIVSPR